MSAAGEQATEAELHAYVDRQLHGARRGVVEAYLTAHPEERERLAAYRGLNDALHALYDPVLREPVPRRLRERGGRGGMAVLRGMAAVVAWLAVGGVAGWWMRGELPGTTGSETAPLVRDAAFAHALYTPERRHAVEVNASEEAHLVKWLSKRLDAPLTAPDLRPLGYALVGGRMLPDDRGRPAAQFMYEDDQGERLTLYIRRGEVDSRETAFRFADGARGSVRVFYWIDGPIGYALAGTLERDALYRMAEAVYGQMTP
jgi:anti-sigma factor RsiW